MGILDVLGLRVAKDEDYNDEPVYGKRNDDIDEEMMFDGEESYGEEEFDDEPEAVEDEAEPEFEDDDTITDLGEDL